MIADGLSLKYGSYMVIAGAALLSAKNVEVHLINDKERILLVKKLNIMNSSMALNKNLCNVLE